jgi:vitamin B12 transporter
MAAFAAMVGGLGVAAPLEASAQIVLEPITVESATLSGEPADTGKLGSSVSVVTGAELEARQIRHAADALRSLPGLAVNQNGGAGALTQVRIRGAEGNQVKVIIDGVEVNSLDRGEFDFATLLATDIDRIEVIRGPQSGIYGANALSGVINIVTRKGDGPARVSASAEAGSFGTHQVTAGASAGSDRAYLSLSAASRETDGFNISRFGTEKDGSEQQAIFARGGWAPSDIFRIDAMGRFQSNDTDIDSDVDGNGLLDDVRGFTNDREQTMGAISAELDTFGKAWKHKVFANILQDDFVSVDPSLPLPFTNEGERTKYGYQTTYTAHAGDFGTHTLTGLIEQIDESFEGRGNEQLNFPPFFVGRETVAERSDTGYAAEWQGAFAEKLFLSANIRRDDKDSFEDATTWRLTGAYVIPETATRFHTSYGKGITDPTFFEQFGSAVDFLGNPGLTPEASIGWDFGVEQKFWANRLIVDLTYFRADLTDEISSEALDLDGDGFPETTRPINLSGESERQGIEIAVSAQLTPALLLTGAYTFTDADSPDGTEEIRRPPHAARLGLAYLFAEGRGRLNANVTYNGEMKDECFGSACPARFVRLDNYVLIDVAASYKLTDNIELFGRVENLLDTDYEEVFSYSSAPVSAFGGIMVSLAAVRPFEPGLN